MYMSLWNIGRKEFPIDPSRIELILTEHLIIIPTYNENDNITPLVKQIFSFCKDVHILIVDDNSQDGTQKRIEELQSEFPKSVFCLKRKKKLGLGSAYVAGFRWGLEKQYKSLMEMDADFSHDPSYLPIFYRNLSNQDIVIGSRYTGDGATVNWSLIRKLISRFGSFYASFLLGVKLSDFTGGFNLWKREVLERINIDTLNSDGYVFQIELKYRGILKGFKAKEIPIVFNERRAGQSKMSMNIVIEAIFKVITLRLAKNRLSLK